MKIYMPPGRKNDVEPNRHYRTVTSLSGQTMVATGDSGLEHRYTVAADAKVTRRGKPCPLSALRAGTRIRIVVEPSDETLVTVVECLRIPGTTIDP